MGLPERVGGTEKLFDEIMDQCLKFDEKYLSIPLRMTTNSNRINKRRSTPRHIIDKELKDNDLEKNLESSKKNRTKHV